MMVHRCMSKLNVYNRRDLRDKCINSFLIYSCQQTVLIYDAWNGDCTHCNYNQTSLKHNGWMGF